MVPLHVLRGLEVAGLLVPRHMGPPADCAGPGGTTPLEPPAALRAPQWYFADTPVARRA
jgi:hypothetical protein